MGARLCSRALTRPCWHLLHTLCCPSPSHRLLSQPCMAYGTTPRHFLPCSSPPGSCNSVNKASGSSASSFSPLPSSSPSGPSSNARTWVARLLVSPEPRTYRRPRARLLLLVGASALLLVVAASSSYVAVLPKHLYRTFTLDDPSAAARITSLRDSLGVLREHPFGVGIGQ